MKRISPRTSLPCTRFRTLGDHTILFVLGFSLRFKCCFGTTNLPEGPARQIDVSRQKLSPHCPDAIFDSQLPSPKLSPKMPPKLSLPHKRGLFFSSFKINPAVRVIARQVRGKNCPAAMFAPRHQSVSSGPLGWP